MSSPYNWEDDELVTPARPVPPDVDLMTRLVAGMARAAHNTRNRMLREPVRYSCCTLCNGSGTMRTIK